MMTDTLQPETRQPRWMRFLAETVSVVFHPVFTGVMMMYYITFAEADIFLGVPARSKLLKFITFANNNLLFPLLIAWLLKGLGFSRSIRMETARERIVPYMSVIIFQFWTWHVFRNQDDSPPVLTAMCLGIFLAASLALVFNNFLKVSMHAIGMGGLTGLMLSLVFLGYAQGGFPPIASILLTGLVCTSRMMVGSHDHKEILVGFLIGLVTQACCQLA
jgi:hypothetical protein